MNEIRLHRGYSDGSWSVVRVNDDGRVEPVHVGLRADAAQLIAGALRDEQTEDEILAGWNVLALGAGELARRQRAMRAGGSTRTGGQ